MKEAGRHVEAAAYFFKQLLLILETPRYSDDRESVFRLKEENHGSLSLRWDVSCDIITRAQSHCLGFD